MCFHKMIIGEIQRDRSMKIFKLFVESIGWTGKAMAMVILFSGYALI